VAHRSSSLKALARFRWIVFATAFVLPPPLHAEATPLLASQVRADAAVLSSEPTLSAGKKSHRDSALDLAHYETIRGQYAVDPESLNRWCAASVNTLPSQTVRAGSLLRAVRQQGALPTLLFGKAYKEAVHHTRWNTSLMMFGESLARNDNFAEIDKTHRDRDAWGIPVLKLSACWSDYEKALYHDGQQQAAEFIEAAGAKDVQITSKYSVSGFLHLRT
jgi:hypothetical protein